MPGAIPLQSISTSGKPLAVQEKSASEIIYMIDERKNATKRAFLPSITINSCTDVSESDPAVQTRRPPQRQRNELISFWYRVINYCDVDTLQPSTVWKGQNSQYWSVI